MKIRGKNSSAANAGRTACLLLAACCWLTAITGTAGAIGGDLNSDGLVDWSDVASLAGGWPQIYVLTDYAHLAVNWLRTDPIANQTACYRLDETGGVTAFDSSGNNRNGTLKVEAGELIENGFAWQPAGVHGGAIMFDGDGVSGENPRPYIEIPTAGMSAAAGMVALWANLADPAPANDDSRNNNIYLFGLYGDTADKVKLYVTGSATLKFNIGNCSFSGTNGFAFTRGQWTHIAILWDNGIYVIYINGSPEPIYSGDGTYTAPSFDTLPATADIGNTGETNKAFSMHGMIDEVRIFNRPMNTAQIRWISDGAVRAWDPSPPDAATDIPVEGIALQWTPARETDTYNIYFGTANSPPFAVNLPITHYQLPPLSPATVYYWRVDGVGAADTVTGNLWSFRTVPLPDEPSSPSPANGAANVDIAADLSWKNGAYTTSSAVYFGTFNPPPFAANLPITNYQLPVASYQLPILSCITGASTRPARAVRPQAVYTALFQHPHKRPSPRKNRSRQTAKTKDG